uniref:Uncharacterized protein n=1 Tax=Parastrongyloides trichosuri TaxID=131310 RepID=A0A0N4Z090_PARTI
MLQNSVTKGKKCWSNKMYANWDINFYCNGTPFTPLELDIVKCEVHLWHDCSTWALKKPTNSQLNFKDWNTVSYLFSSYVYIDVKHKCNLTGGHDKVCKVWPGDECLSCNNYEESKCTFNIELNKTSSENACHSF